MPRQHQWPYHEAAEARRQVKSSRPRCFSLPVSRCAVGIHGTTGSRGDRNEQRELDSQQMMECKNLNVTLGIFLNFFQYTNMVRLHGGFTADSEIEIE